MINYKISKKIKDFNKSIKLDLNEYDFKHPDKFYQLLSDSIKTDKIITHYSNTYNDNTLILINKLSIYNNILDDNILLTAGSDNALEYVVNKYINNNTTVLLFYPTYNYFETIIKKKTSNIEYINIDIEDTNYDVDKYLKNYILNNNSVVYIVNPNNPIGNIINIASLEKYLEQYNQTLFIVDEAYIEFAEVHSCIELINKFNNLIIIRTFSKAYGLAGMRLGYIATSSVRRNEIYESYNEKSLTELTKIAGIFVIENINYYKSIINIIIEERQMFEIFLKENDIYYTTSNANFILFYVGNEYNTFLNVLEENNIIIRNKNNDMKGFLRITIGTQDNMSFVKKIFKENIHLFDKYN
jgi:histidinol-phosphate aminotransferase